MSSAEPGWANSAAPGSSRNWPGAASGVPTSTFTGACSARANASRGPAAEPAQRGGRSADGGRLPLPGRPRPGTAVIGPGEAEVRRCPGRLVLVDEGPAQLGVRLARVEEV